MHRRFSIGLLLLAAAGGCGGGDPYKPVPVTGRVVYEDGAPIPGHRIVVRFVPQVQPVSAKEFPRPGYAELSTDGSFSKVTTHKPNDGVIPGPQKVLVISLDTRERPTGAVDPKYADAGTTPLSAEVKAGGEPLELKVARPTGARR